MESWRQELYHHGIKGQKWGVRRFQNRDGSLTSSGRNRYGDKSEKKKKSYFRQRASTQAKAAAISGAASVATAAATAAGVSALAKRGKMDAAAKTYYYGKKATQSLKFFSGANALNAGINYRLARAFEVDYKNSGSRKKAPSNSNKSHNKTDNASKSDKPKINKKKVAVGAAVVAGSALAVYGAVKYKKISGTSSTQTASKASEAVKLVSNTASRGPSGASKVASAAKSASKPITSLSGKDTGFTQADIDRMVSNLGKMSEIAKNGQDVLKNL